MNQVNEHFSNMLKYGLAIVTKITPWTCYHSDSCRHFPHYSMAMRTAAAVYIHTRAAVFAVFSMLSSRVEKVQILRCFSYARVVILWELYQRTFSSFGNPLLTTCVCCYAGPGNHIVLQSSATTVRE